MITASFRHIAGIGPLRERQLWFSGVRSWGELPAAGDVLSPRLDGRLRAGVSLSRERFDAGDLDHFARALPQTEHWRLLPQLIDGAGYLDIEAAGDRVTVIGVMDSLGVRSFVGEAISEFPARALSWKCLVTFNGTAFDLPILRRVFPEWQPPAAHIDLRHVFARLREKGGLKELEQRFGLFRPPELAALSGADAAGLWAARGSPGALRRLLLYNLYDVFHLKPLAELGYNRLLKRTGLPAPELPLTERGSLLYDVSLAAEAALQSWLGGAQPGE